MSSTALPDLKLTSNPWRIERDEAHGVVWITTPDAPEPEPADWRDRMVQAMRTLHGTAVVGAKRLTEEGRVFSMGEFIVHPKGFHHVGKGVLPQAYRFPLEVDAVAGGILAVDAALYDQVAEEVMLSEEIGPVELCLALRKRGYRCIVVPQVVITDTFTPAPDESVNEQFQARWGFDWRAADLDAIRQHEKNHGLVWNARYHAPSMPFDKYESRPAVHWTNYRDVDVYRQRADHLIKLACQNVSSGPALDLGCGDGLFTHLLALQGIETIGVDPEDVAIQQARQQVAQQTYPAGKTPTFSLGVGDTLEFPDDYFQLVMLLDVIEHLPNPVAVLREIARVLAPGGAALISTPAWQYAGWSDPFYHVVEYSPEELARQVTVAGGMQITDAGRIGGVYRDLIVVARTPAG